MLLEPVLRRLGVPQIADQCVDAGRHPGLADSRDHFVGVHLSVPQAVPRRSGHVCADSGDAQGTRLSSVRNTVTWSECWRDLKRGCAGCQRGEQKRLQKGVGDRFWSPAEPLSRRLVLQPNFYISRDQRPGMTELGNAGARHSTCTWVVRRGGGRRRRLTCRSRRNGPCGRCAAALCNGPCSKRGPRRGVPRRVGPPCRPRIRARGR